MTDILERLANQPGPVTVNQTVNPEGGEDRALESFQRFSPSKFSGGSNLEMVEGWLERITDIFAALNYMEERQVAFAVFQFERAARSWWNMIRVKWDREQTPRTWVNFTLEFNAKFLPPLIQEKRENDFIKCKQGLLSIAEYETLFIKLSKFTPELVATEQRRIRRFIQGLNVEIQEGLAAIQITSFSDTIERAQRIESAKTQVRAFNARKRNAPSGSLGPVDTNAPPPKFGRGVNTSGAPRETMTRGATSRGAFSRGTSSGRGQSRNVPQGSQASTPSMIVTIVGRLITRRIGVRKKRGNA
nr:uncharacterized protein LOC113740970 [Coffea arabica]